MMKLFARLAFFLLVIVLVGEVCAQSTASASRERSYKFGERTVLLPTPDGFVSVGPRYPKTLNRFKAMTSTTYELVAGYVEESLIPRLEDGDDPDLGFFIKVSIPKTAKDVDTTAETYAQFVAEFEKNSPTLFDPNGPVMTTALKTTRERMNERYGKDVEVNLSEPQNLGIFDKRPDVLSALVIITVEEFGRKFQVLSAGSFIRVKDRFLTVGVYKRFIGEKDIQDLQDFAKGWNTQILDENK